MKLMSFFPAVAQRAAPDGVKIRVSEFDPSSPRGESWNCSRRREEAESGAASVSASSCRRLRDAGRTSWKSWLWRWTLSLSAALLALTALPAARAVIYDFSGPVQNVAASYASGVVTLSAFDPVAGLRVAKVSSGATFDLTASDGVAAWSSGSTVYYYIYDSARTNWIGEAVITGMTHDLRNARGVVAWSSGAAVFCRVYDRARASWRAGALNANAPSILTVVDGVVAGTTAAGVFVSTYDPARGDWQSASAGGTPAELTNTNGVASWSSSGTVFALIYDPTGGGWRGRSVPSGGAFSLSNVNGIVAWVNSPNVFFMTYDPARGQWMFDFVSSGYTPSVTVSNSTVFWMTSAQSYIRGYNPAAGAWYAGPGLPLAAFTVSTNAGNAPLFVYFGDLSIGGSVWAWSFGEGAAASSARSPSFRYTTFDQHAATLTISGSFGISSTNRLILSDLTAPTGSIVINNGESFTTNTIVHLTLSATDNSGTVASMRLSNDASTWSAWETYTTSRTWVVTSGVGTRTVSAQFRDRAGNVSATVSDSIQVDTTPLPTVSFVSTNVAENAGSATVLGQLSQAFTRAVLVNVFTSDGTATAGVDYVATNRTLLFPVGSTAQVFTVTIKDDPDPELNETVILNFGTVSNAVAGSAGTLTIVDNDLPSVAFAAATYSVGEADGNAMILLKLNAASSVPVNVRLLADPGTALNGSDFVATNLLVTFAAGRTNQVATITIVNNDVDEPAETVSLSLSSATNAVLGAPATATLTILDDDPPHVLFTEAAFVVSENVGVAFIDVRLTKAYGQNVFVDYTAAGGTAIAGTHYTPTSGTLPFVAGQTNKQFLVTVINNGQPDLDPERTVHLRLSNVVGGSLGLRDEADLVIRDDDVPPRLSAPRIAVSGLFQTTLIGAPGQRFTVQRADALVNWTNLVTLTNATGMLLFTDPISPNANQRFYRTALLP